MDKCVGVFKIFGSVLVENGQVLEEGKSVGTGSKEIIGGDI